MKAKKQSDMYSNWSNMKARCQNPKLPSYPRYGGRGIKVCERWQKFENFYADMSPKPFGATIERINNNGHYSPENCKWADYIAQGRNRRSNIFYLLNGVRLHQTDVAQILGVSDGALLKWRRRGGISSKGKLKKFDLKLIENNGVAA
jgi:hypothetical protein